MGSNTSNGKALKGSKYLMQLLVNSAYKTSLDEAIGLGTINWLSPLKSDNYREYQLNYDETSGLSIPKATFDFWPSRQPQWDAIGETESNIILVEAKAHLSEINSRMFATNPESIHLIEESMKEVHRKHYPNGEFTLWKNKYYQIANRLTFLHHLQENSQIKKDIKLVFLNYINDYSYKPICQNNWENHFDSVMKKVTGLDCLPNNILVIYYDVEEVKE